MWYSLALGEPVACISFYESLVLFEHLGELVGVLPQRLRLRVIMMERFCKELGNRGLIRVEARFQGLVSRKNALLNSAVCLMLVIAFVKEIEGLMWTRTLASSDVLCIHR